jgi:hypothetical protein
MEHHYCSPALPELSPRCIPLGTQTFSVTEAHQTGASLQFRIKSHFSSPLICFIIAVIGRFSTIPILHVTSFSRNSAQHKARGPSRCTRHTHMEIESLMHGCRNCLCTCLPMESHHSKSLTCDFRANGRFVSILYTISCILFYSAFFFSLCFELHPRSRGVRLALNAWMEIMLHRSLHSLDVLFEGTAVQVWLGIARPTV